MAEQLGTCKLNSQYHGAEPHRQKVTCINWQPLPAEVAAPERWEGFQGHKPRCSYARGKTSLESCDCGWYAFCHRKLTPEVAEKAISPSRAPATPEKAARTGDAATTWAERQGAAAESPAAPAATDDEKLCPECGHSASGIDGVCLTEGCGCEYDRALPAETLTPEQANFVTALKVADGVFEDYRESQPKWWKRMDGTPILNDIATRMASAFLHYHRAASRPLEQKIQELERAARAGGKGSK